MKIKTGITIWLTIVIAIVVVVGVIMSYFVADYFKQTILNRDVESNAKFIAIQARQHLTADDYLPQDFEKKSGKFSQFFNEVNTDEIVRIKVWSTDKTVVYSDEKDIVSKTFHDNDELNESFEDGGHVVTEISDLTKAESAEDKKFGQLIEMYIPIKSDSGKIIGVIETYASMNPVNTYIENANKIIYTITMIGIGVVGVVILLTFGTFRKNVIKPIIDIHSQTKLIQDGKLDIKFSSTGYDEVRKLGNEIELMASKLKEHQDRIAKTERLSAIGELAARLAHDLRNPLNIIKNSLMLIRFKYAPQPESEKDFDRIARSVSRMSHQLENVMDFVTSKGLEVDEKSLNEIIKNAVDRAIIPDSIQVNFPSEDFVIKCDPEKLEIVLDNILVNAKQAINNSGTIDIRSSQEENFTKIEIHDSGPGIPDAILPKIFEPLFTTKQEGTGLGLSSCKSIIEQHDGNISVKTESGKGTTFVITLPIVKSQKSIIITE